MDCEKISVLERINIIKQAILRIRDIYMNVSREIFIWSILKEVLTLILLIRHDGSDLKGAIFLFYLLIVIKHSYFAPRNNIKSTVGAYLFSKCIDNRVLD